MRLSFLEATPKYVDYDYASLSSDEDKRNAIESWLKRINPNVSVEEDMWDDLIELVDNKTFRSLDALSKYISKNGTLPFNLVDTLNDERFSDLLDNPIYAPFLNNREFWEGSGRFSDDNKRILNWYKLLPGASEEQRKKKHDIFFKGSKRYDRVRSFNEIKRLINSRYSNDDVYTSLRKYDKNELRKSSSNKNEIILKGIRSALDNVSDVDGFIDDLRSLMNRYDADIE